MNVWLHDFPSCLNYSWGKIILYSKRDLCLNQFNECSRFSEREKRNNFQTFPIFGPVVTVHLIFVLTESFPFCLISDRSQNCFSSSWLVLRNPFQFSTPPPPFQYQDLFLWGLAFGKFLEFWPKKSIFPWQKSHASSSKTSHVYMIFVKSK